MKIKRRETATIDDCKASSDRLYLAMLRRYGEVFTSAGGEWPKYNRDANAVAVKDPLLRKISDARENRRLALDAM